MLQKTNITHKNSHENIRWFSYTLRSIFENGPKHTKTSHTEGNPTSSFLKAIRLLANSYKKYHEKIQSYSQHVETSKMGPKI